MPLPRPMPSRLLVPLLLAVALSLVAQTGRSAAQGYDCGRLRQEIATAGRPDPQRSAGVMRELQRQRSELARTRAYSDQLGCTRGFLIFEGGGPPQCGGLLDHIDGLTSSIGSLQQQIDQGGTGSSDRQAALIEQYRAYCGTDPSALNSDEFYDGSAPPGLDNEDGGQPSGGKGLRYSKIICVRTCDGGFFPLSFSPAQRDTEGLQGLCSALCPNTEAKVFSTPDLDNVGAAVSVEGAAYTDLPNAFQYQKTFNATCSCKPPNKSWVEALADAEKLLDTGKGKDVTVTAQMSDEMAKPIAPVGTAVPGKTPASNASRKKKSFDQAQIKAILDAQVAAEGALGAVGAQAPTAGTESAGIANDAGKASPVLRTDEGQVKTDKAPDGTTRRVRIIGPAL